MDFLPSLMSGVHGAFSRSRIIENSCLHSWSARSANCLWFWLKIDLYASHARLAGCGVDSLAMNVSSPAFVLTYKGHPTAGRRLWGRLKAGEICLFNSWGLQATTCRGRRSYPWCEKHPKRPIVFLGMAASLATSGLLEFEKTGKIIYQERPFVPWLPGKESRQLNQVH